MCIPSLFDGMLTRSKLYIVVFAISVCGLLIVQYQNLNIEIGLENALCSKEIDLARTTL